MKRVLILIFLLLPVAAFADEDRPIRFGDLPTGAQKLISGYFPDAKVTLATVDREFLDTSYDVILDDGTRMEFDSRGEWKEIECRAGSVPEGVMPPQIVSFLAEHYPQARVKDIERDKQGYEVNLDNRRELSFDAHGNFRGYDD